MVINAEAMLKQSWVPGSQRWTAGDRLLGLQLVPQLPRLHSNWVNVNVCSLNIYAKKSLQYWALKIVFVLSVFCLMTRPEEYQSIIATKCWRTASDAHCWCLWLMALSVLLVVILVVTALFACRLNPSVRSNITPAVKSCSQIDLCQTPRQCFELLSTDAQRNQHLGRRITIESSNYWTDSTLKPF